MIEIRPIRRDEAVPFLRLLCDVFKLEFNRAHGVFFGEPMFDLQRKWGLFDDGALASILTTVPVEFGHGMGIGIAGVATREDRQRQGLARQLINEVVARSEENGETSAWLFARNQSLYRECGFREVDEVLHAELGGEVDNESRDLLSYPEVRRLYGQWSGRDPSRLRRDDRRWNYWKWNMRPSTPFADGYICHEGFQVRECVVETRNEPWRFLAQSVWVGLRSMSERLQLPLVNPRHEIYLMGRNAEFVPQMFLTDQF